MNILIPMAGRGSRFQQANFDLPKPLIHVNGRPMIEWVIDNIRANTNDKFIFVVRQEHILYHNIDEVLKVLAPGCIIQTVEQVTEGAACTCLVSKKHIDTNDELLIANCDQLMIWNKLNFDVLRTIAKPDGIIFIFESTSPKNSYAQIEDNRIVRVVEKQVISKHATCGVYYWKHGHDFVNSAEQMMANNDRINNEFYVCPTYDYLIKNQQTIVPFFTDDHYPIGTPEDLTAYLLRSKNATLTQSCLSKISN